MLLAVLVGITIPASFTCWLLHYISSLTLYYPNDVYIINPRRWLVATFFPMFMFAWGLRTHSISKSGAVIGYLIGFVIALSNACFLASLLVFFIFGSRVTKFRSRYKRRIDVDFKEGGQRNWLQVLCNGGIATQLAVFYISEVGCHEEPLNFSTHYTASGLSVAVLAAIACCCGDTFASEIGSVVGGSDPRLITTFRRVPRGTNGGVSLMGCLASLLGGAVVGLAYYIALYLSLADRVWSANRNQWLVILYGSLAGFLGSLLDSVLGATLQYSGYHERTCRVVDQPGPAVTHISGRMILDNHGVNLISSFMTSFILPIIAFHSWKYIY